ncbi:hypothetical protein AI2BBH_12840 [Alistipes indistinctus]|nr:hypothetical protein AI2BBH_12840 [Alistipes indistinctus]
MTVESRADLSGVVSGTAFPANTDKVFSVVGYSGTAAPTDWSSPYIVNVAVNSGEKSVLTFAKAQYYPINGDKVYFYAYSPVNGTYTAGNGSAAPKVSWTITGQEDVMAAQVTEGIAKNPVPANQPQPNFAFTHKLKQVKFQVIRDASFEENIKLTSLMIIGTNTEATMDLATGAVTWGAATSDLPVYDDAAGQDITATASAVGDAMMLSPGASFKVRAVAGGVTYDDITVTLAGTNAGAAGVSHEVTLTFKRKEIVPTATIAEWTDGGEGTTWEGYPRVENGNTIVLRDIFGSAEDRYPIHHKPWTATPAHEEAAWDTNVSGYNTVGEKFRVASSDAKGKNGSSLTMTWFEASGTTDATYNSDGYSACAQYSEETDQSDKGLWRLPTIRELKLIYVYRNSIANSFITDRGYYSATRKSDSNNYAWYDYFSYSSDTVYTCPADDRHYVRCVRDEW